MKLRRFLSLAAVLGGILLLSGGHIAAVEDYSDVTIQIITAVGPVIVEPIKRHAGEFKKLTGATITVTNIENYNDIHPTMLQDFSSGSKQYDAAVYPSVWMADFAEPGYLEDLTDRVEADEALNWEDVAPFFRKLIATYKGRVYSIPLDGDFHMLYYRTDVLEQAGLEPPKTWDAYLEAAKALHGQDMNGDDEPDYGSCLPMASGVESYWYFMSIASSFIQSNGTSQGVFFDTRGMKPLVNNEAFETALNVYTEMMKYEPPDAIELDTRDTRTLFTAGRCALTVEWGDIGTLAIAPGSQIKDKVGATILPGSRKVLDWDTGKFTECDPSRCPYAIDGINHAPFAAYGGWSASINAASDDKTKEAAYAFFSYMSQTAQSGVDVTIGATGFNPYRFSHFQKADPWLQAGMSEEAVKAYLGGIGKSLNNPNMVIDLKISQNHRYLGQVLDSALNKLLKGEISAKEAMVEIEQGWEAITEEVGRDKQLRDYRLSLGGK